MFALDTYTIIIALSGLVMLSYVFSLISAKTRIPAVLMLLLLGIGIREALNHFNSYVEIPLDVIQFVGVFGLILILLEAGLDLNISRSKLPLIRSATASSALVLALSVLGISSVVHFLLGQDWQISLIYAVPLAVISSSIVASSIQYLGEEKREFLTYEASLSDILGILLFNFLIADKALSAGVVATSLGSIALAIAVSVIVSVLLIWLLVKVTIDIKVFLLFAALLLIYALGHVFDLPTLLTVLIFGLIINNWYKIKSRRAEKYLPIQSVSLAAYSLKSLTSESAFLVRTFFFTLFGYMIDIRVLGDPKVLLVGTIIVGIIYLVRYLYLRLFMREHILPELFFAPRGLVTIVLFYKIPDGFTFDSFDDGVLFFVILITSLVMMLGGIWFTPKEATREAEEELEEAREQVALASEPLPPPNDKL